MSLRRLSSQNFPALQIHQKIQLIPHLTEYSKETRSESFPIVNQKSKSTSPKLSAKPSLPPPQNLILSRNTNDSGGEE